MNAWKSYLLNSIEYVFRIGRLFSAPAAVLRRARRLSQLRGKCIYPVPASLQLDGDIDIVGTGRFRIDEYSRLGNNVYLETHDSGEIEIGKRVRINAPASRFAASHMTSRRSRSAGMSGSAAAAVF